MIEFFKTLQGFVVIGATAGLACWAWVASIKTKAVQGERVRVEEVGKKIDAKAQTARKRAVTDADRVLPRYYRD